VKGSKGSPSAYPIKESTRLRHPWNHTTWHPKTSMDQSPDDASPRNAATMCFTSAQLILDVPTCRLEVVKKWFEITKICIFMAKFQGLNIDREFFWHINEWRYRALLGAFRKYDRTHQSKANENDGGCGSPPSLTPPPLPVLGGNRLTNHLTDPSITRSLPHSPSINATVGGWNHHLTTKKWCLQAN